MSLLLVAVVILALQSVDAQIFRIPLIEAVRIGNAKEVQRLLNNGANPNQKPTKLQGPNGLSALHVAAISDRVTIAKMLLEAGAKVTIRDDLLGGTPLFAAAGNASTTFVELLLEYGANIHSKSSDGFTPLHGAAKGANIEVAKFLIEKGADVSARSIFGDTPLDVISYTDGFHHTLSEANAMFDYLIGMGAKTGLELTELKLRVRNAPRNAPALYIYGVIGKTYEVQHSYDLKEWQPFNTVKTKLTHTSDEEGGPFVGYVNTAAPTQYFRWRLVEE
ncbi:MAG: ankyrin repeat domain-containing protein [Verrucomicrobia bacterium]|nr:ankyrin repeat domain-containing protein [Verrucomicrobiota bacterium]